MLGGLLKNLPGMQLLQKSPLGQMLGLGGGQQAGGGQPPGQALSQDGFNMPNPMDIAKKFLGG
jgi:hypothetical protein